MSMSTIELIDTHVHLDDDRFDDDRDQVVARANASGVKSMIVPATTRQRWPRLLSIANRYSGIYTACGLHPWFLNEHTESDLTELARHIDRHPCVAIGECGLDRFCLGQQLETRLEPGLNQALKKEDLFARQLFFFETQLDIAAKADLPVIVHALQAVDDVILSIKKSAATQGVVHSFNGSPQQATRLIDLGYRLSFGGAVTQPRSTKNRRLVQSLPADSILIETDAPDQTGYENRGRRNEPAYLAEVLQTVADLRGASTESVACQCNQNAENLFTRLTINPNTSNPCC